MDRRSASSGAFDCALAVASGQRLHEQTSESSRVGDPGMVALGHGVHEVPPVMGCASKWRLCASILYLL